MQISKELENILISEYLNGKPINKISAEYKIDHKIITKIFTRNNIEIKFSSNRILPEKEIIDKYVNYNMSLTQLAKEYKSSTEHLRKLMIKNNIKLHDRNPKQNLIGMKFNHLTAISFIENTHPSRFLFKCDCGKTVSRVGTVVKNGKCKDCGCISGKDKRNKSKYINYKHGDYKSRLYSTWTSMLYRCSNKNLKCYKNYGGRGITVCEEWKNYNTFKKWAIDNGYTDELTIDRINVNGNYCPENCRWVTMQVQCDNKRNSRFIYYKNLKHTSCEWERITNIPRLKIYNYAKRHNWTIDNLISKEEEKING